MAFHQVVDRPASLPVSLYHPPRFSHSLSVAMSPDPTSLSSLGSATRAVHVGNRPDETTGAVLQPLTLSTTFKQHTPNVPFNCQSTSSSLLDSPGELNFSLLCCSCWLDRASFASFGRRLSLELARCASSPADRDPAFSSSFASTLLQYGRDGNPNRDSLETVLASLEHGHAAFATPSGTAATSLIVQALGANAHCLAIRGIYSGSSLSPLVCRLDPS